MRNYHPAREDQRVVATVTVPFRRHSWTQPTSDIDRVALSFPLALDIWERDREWVMVFARRATRAFELSRYVARLDTRQRPLSQTSTQPYIDPSDTGPDPRCPRALPGTDPSTPREGTPERRLDLPTRHGARGRRNPTATRSQFPQVSLTGGAPKATGPQLDQDSGPRTPSNRQRTTGGNAGGDHKRGEEDYPGPPRAR